jgi:hypothetical protein
MIQKIEQQKDILHPTELPNIKLVRTWKDERVLFDGHHTILAYMSVGRTYLDEVPHLVVANDGSGCVDDEEISIFYGEHKIDGDWRKYCINWQAEKGEQLCWRIQKSMGELFESISCLDLSAVSKYQITAVVNWLLENQEGLELSGEEMQSPMPYVDDKSFLGSNCGSIKTMLENLQCFDYAVE